MNSKSRLRRVAIIVLISVVVAGLVVSAVAQRWLLVDLPSPTKLYQYVSAPSTKIFDRHGQLLYEITDPHQGLRTPLTLKEIPEACLQATIATEDSSFYRNLGVDVRAIVRALYINLRGGEVLSGGSTITQQLARNLLLSPQERSEISLSRKLREAILAFRLARNYSKDEILTLYFNETYYGSLAYGLEAASRTYFGKHAAELDLAECALLAGLPQSPVNYNPLENLDAAKRRQTTVLDLMAKQRYITHVEADSARREKLGFAAVPFPIEAPHFVMYVRGELERRFGLEAIYSRGLQVQTSLDLNMQHTARRIVRHHLAKLAEPEDGLPARNVRNAAVVIVNPHSGEVLAMLGSPDYFNSRIDGAVNATTATRQPGSSIKPITYAAAFDPAIASTHAYAPLTPASMMIDVRTAFVTKEGRPYAPENYDRTWRGPVLMRQSLASSFNLIAVKVLDYVGLDAMTGLARSLGITTFDNQDFGLALTLGGGEVRLLELAAAYGTFANGGRRLEPVTISRVTDHNGELLFKLARNNNPGPEVIDPRTAYLITHILSDDYARRSTFGAGSALQLSRPAAAKTGTTQDWRDNWTVGYTPGLVVGVWTGNADNEPMQHVSGVTGAAPIWHDLMEELLKARPVQDFPRPPGLVERTVCAQNGLLPDQASPKFQPDRPDRRSKIAVICSHTVTELFIAGTEPQRVDDWHQAVLIDRRTGLLAGPNCPLDVVTLKKFTDYPAEAESWVRRQGVPRPPSIYSPFCPQVAVVRTDSGPDTRPGIDDQRPVTGERSPVLVFANPDQGSVFRLVPNLPAHNQKIRVAVRQENGAGIQDIVLFINGEPMVEASEALWQLVPGVHTFAAVGSDPTGQRVSANEVTIEVLE